MKTRSMSLGEQQALAAARLAEHARKAPYAQIAYYRELLVSELRHLDRECQRALGDDGYGVLAGQIEQLPLNDPTLRQVLGGYSNYEDPCFDGLSANEFSDLIEPFDDRFGSL